MGSTKQSTLQVVFALSLLMSAGCASSPNTQDPNAPGSTEGAYTGGAGEIGTTPVETVNASSGVTEDDALPDFNDVAFNAYPLQGIRPRIVEITVETSRTLSKNAGNKAQILQVVREGLEKALSRSNISVVARATNKVNFEIKDCRNMGDSAECVHIDAILRTPRFELEVGGYSHNSYVAPGSSDSSSVRGDLTRAYQGAINAVMERLNKQLEIVGMHQ